MADFNVEQVLAQLTLDEKISLLKGRLDTCASEVQPLLRIIYRKGFLAYSLNPTSWNPVNSNVRRSKWSLWHPL